MFLVTQLYFLSGEGLVVELIFTGCMKFCSQIFFYQSKTN